MVDYKYKHMRLLITYLGSELGLKTDFKLAAGIGGSFRFEFRKIEE